MCRLPPRLNAWNEITVWNIPERMNLSVLGRNETIKFGLTRHMVV
jgi:hypothetical protein